MKKRYRIEYVSASVGAGANLLEEALNKIGMDEQVKQVIPYADGGGYTRAYLVVIEPLSR